MRAKLTFLLLTAPLLAQQAAPPAAPPPFRVEETSIAQIHDAMKAGRLTCHALVDAYLRRIEAYDKNGPSLNAIAVINPDATTQADELDRRFAQSGLTGPLHCIPAIVKDNFETIGLQSAGGSLSLKGFVSNKDAFQVKRIKDAGAIVLAKSNMAEFAFSPYETVNSVLPGYSHNPYALDRVTAGSSGGTAAAVAANLGEVGLGTDTGNSIRGPSSHQALVGIRSTMGLTSRAGIAPLSLFQDIAGPMARSVADAVAVFQVIVGYDAHDPVTQAAAPPDSSPGCQSRQLRRDALRTAVTHLMDSLKLDALIYPTWSNPPRLIGDLNTPHGDNSQVFSPQTGMPALTVPMGYTRNNALPAGLQMLGRAFDEQTLIKFAYAYEQATKHRRAPPHTP